MPDMEVDESSAPKPAKKNIPNAKGKAKTSLGKKKKDLIISEEPKSEEEAKAVVKPKILKDPFADYPSFISGLGDW
jgi:hypothetical protein